MRQFVHTSFFLVRLAAGLPNQTATMQGKQVRHNCRAAATAARYVESYVKIATFTNECVIIYGLFFSVKIGTY